MVFREHVLSIKTLTINFIFSVLIFLNFYNIPSVKLFKIELLSISISVLHFISFECTTIQPGNKNQYENILHPSFAFFWKISSCTIFTSNSEKMTCEHKRLQYCILARMWHDQGKWVTCRKCQFLFSYTTFS